MANYTRAYKSINTAFEEALESTTTKRLSSGTETFVNRNTTETLTNKSFTETPIDNSIPEVVVKTSPINDDIMEDNLRRILRGLPTQAELSRNIAKNEMSGKTLNQFLEDVPSQAEVSRRLGQQVNSNDHYKMYDRFGQDVANNPYHQVPDLKALKNEKTWGSLKESKPNQESIDQRIQNTDKNSIYKFIGNYFSTKSR